MGDERKPEKSAPRTTIKWGAPKHDGYELVVHKEGKYTKPEYAIAFDDEVIEIDRVPIRIGRDKDNDIVILDDHDLISRSHARLYCEDGKYFIQDAGSTNGTYVNKNPLARNEGAARLQPGDILCFGGRIDAKFGYWKVFLKEMNEKAQKAAAEDSRLVDGK